VNPKDDSLFYFKEDKLIELLHGYSTFVLTTHVNPDGDAIGCEIAFANALRQLGKKTSILNTSGLPANFHFLNSDGIIQTFNEAKHSSLLINADVIVILDVNAASRLQQMEKSIRTSRAQKIVIDHHLDPLPFADGYFVKPEACATAEILYDLFESMPAFRMTKEIAEALYIGIMTDTGSFRFERTTARVHRIIANLLEHGVVPVEIHRKIFDEYPAQRSVLLGHMLTNMETISDGRATIMTISQKVFSDTGTIDDDAEGFVNFGLSIRDVEVTALLTEQSDAIKISFRSKGCLPVNALAKQFGGGGHRYAAGARVVGSYLEDVKRAIQHSFEELLSR